MKSISIFALSLVFAPMEAQIVHAPKRLRAGESKEWGSRQSNRQMTRDGDRVLARDDPSMSMPDLEMIVDPTVAATMTTTASTTTAEEEWQIYQLCSTCKIKYRVNVPEDTNAEECLGCSVSMELIHEGEAWLGIAFSETGRMVGSEAVIGLPGDGQVQKYSLGGYYTGAAQPMSDDKQTLTNASIEVVDGQTIMKFTKLLQEDGEIEILAGRNTMLLAHGYGPNLGYHQLRMAFHLTL
mmetsp:Transcript_12618/g.22617  ORF Transcript_12618/g.22617 Transcript_12618/m.22617 type:complete len:239 (+) Transcript_12618:96-812(+)